ncbi:MAG: hypothetical protein O7H40_17425 [Gammaproteobacteria bacterium]|nr:hypothetical protein [Gammaproteobacteria bacterium]
MTQGLAGCGVTAPIAMELWISARIGVWLASNGNFIDEYGSMKQTKAICFSVLLVASTMAWNGQSLGAENIIATSHFIVDYQDISEQTARLVAEDGEQAFSDVMSLLNRSYSRKIHIKIGKKFKFPRSTAKDATMEIPANRLGRKGATRGPKSIRGRGATIWNGVANVVAPSGHPLNGWGRFLKEGFGVYLQEKFGGKKPRPWPHKVYPAMAEDLHRATGRLTAAYDRFLSLEEAKSHVNRRRLDRTRRLAWVQAGSFVRYLIENRGGVEPFLKWYDGSRFEHAYGTDIGTVEREWVSFINGLRS